MKSLRKYIIIGLAFSLFPFLPGNGRTTEKKEQAELPLGLSINTDILLSRWNAQTYLMPITSFENKSNPIFSDEEYTRRLQLIPTTLEMPFNELVKQFIQIYTSEKRKSVAYMLGASNFYIPIFEEILVKYNLPLELKYLPFVESALDPYAKDAKGATGLWLWKITEAREYGLTENSLIDERLNVYKSTEAAVKRLAVLHKKYNDWGLTLAAYNCGITEVEKAITKAKGAKDFWEIYPYLPKIERTYYPAFIAFNYVVNNYHRHDIAPLKVVLPEMNDTIHLTKNLYFEQIAELCSISIDQIKALNPQYLTNLIPGGSQECTLTLPLKTIREFIKVEDRIYDYKITEFKKKRNIVKVAKAPVPVKKKPTTLYTRVKSGQSLSVIAKKYGTSVKQLLRLNNMKSSNLRAGQSLRVR